MTTIIARMPTLSHTSCRRAYSTGCVSSISMMVAGFSVTEVVVAEKMQTTPNSAIKSTFKNNGQSK